MTRRVGLLMVALALGFSAPASAQSADDIRGGWVAEVDGAREIYILKVRGNQVTGIFCSDCEDFDNLAFIRNGTVDAGRILFQVYHDQAEDLPFTRRVSGQFVNGELQVRIQRQGTSEQIEQTLRRMPRTGAVNAPPFPAAPPPPPVEEAPAEPDPADEPAEAEDEGGGRGDADNEVTTEIVEGVWTAGEGAQRQTFMFRQVFRDVLGMACGPCDNPNTMAIIDSATIGGTNVFFDIVHEDAGTDGNDAPYVQVVDATVEGDNLIMNIARTDQPNSPSIVTAVTKVGGVLNDEDEEDEAGN